MGWQGRGIFAMPFSPLAKTVRHDSVRRRGFAVEGEVSVKVAAVNLKAV